MPNYGTLQPGGGVTALQPGDSMTLFNAESPVAPQASIAFARAMGPTGNDAGMTFSIDFAVAPTATVAIQSANIDLEADYSTLYTSTNTQHDKYTDVGRAAFYRAKVLTQSVGGAITVTVQR